MSEQFEDLWNFIVKRSDDMAMPVVQNKTELEYVFNILRDCQSYLEVGTAEGNSLYVLANALPEQSEITYIDWAEPHTKEKRDFVLDKLKNYKITEIHADSNDFKTASLLSGKTFDVVLIDAGHDDFNVAIDSILYGSLATKYIIFHDVQLPDVSRAFEWYAKQRPECRAYRIVNSPTYGYGILELP